MGNSVEKNHILRRLLEAIASGKLLPESMMQVDVDSLLDIHDSEQFEDEAIPRIKALSELCQAYEKEELTYVFDFIQEVFLHVFKKTRSDDFAAYVSDDFGMFAKALHCGFEDQWINGLVKSYASHVVPWAESSDSDGPLRAHLESLCEG